MEGDSGLDVVSNDGILDIIPPSEYDPFEAKFCASLFWLVFHATEDGGLEDVPSQVTSPIQRLNKKNGFVVHPEIVEFLCKGEVYCVVCARIFPGKVMLAGHWSVIQTLSRNGVYVVDGHTDVAVTDSSLEQTNPFSQGAHIALMDALMTAYSSQVVSIQSVVQAVRRFSTFSASRELPFDLEDALLLWINKTNIAVNSKCTQASTTGKLLRNREQVKKAGLRSEISEETNSVMFPVIDDLLKGLCDGRALLGVLMFYEPNVINIEDISCSREVSTEDSIRNLDVFLGLCSQYFCTSVLALKVEDILYGSPSLKINIVALLAEMFSKCESNEKQEQDIARSKTSCSEHSDVRINGHDNSDSGTRSHSAPISRSSHILDKSSAKDIRLDSGNAVCQDRNIALKIQNYVENGSMDIGTESSGKHTPLENRKSSNMTSLNTTSSHWMSSDDTMPSEDNGKDTVKVQGVVVKLRKKVARNVEPGGGHEAVPSRRMKKGLCGLGRENSSETASQASDQEEQFDVKSDERPVQPSVVSEDTHHTISHHPDTENSDVPDQPYDHFLNLDLDTLPDADPPVDMLSPISETTEPGGSAGNSLNNSLSQDQQELLHQGEGDHYSLTPPKAHTPRKAMNTHSRAKEDLISRGSYIISDITHTPESAIAAGIPIVERASIVAGQYSDGRLYRSAAVSSMQSNVTHEPLNLDDDYHPVIHDSTNFSNQRYSSSNGGHKVPNNTDLRLPDVEHECSRTDNQQNPTDYWSDRRNDDRFSTFTKGKKNHDNGDNSSEAKFASNEQSGKARKSFADTKDPKTRPGPSITWFGHVETEADGGDHHKTSNGGSESGVRKTNWGEMASEVQTGSSSLIEQVPSTSPSKPDPVSRELNLLRLRLAEKQRDIEAQKQRTKEQLEEERKRFGQNVFWLAVGKGREKKDRNEINSPAKVMRHKQHFAATCSEEGKSQNLGSTAFTKHSSFDEELPPSMGKLQDRTYHLKANDDLSMKDIRTTSIPEEKVLNENASPMSETFAQHLVEGRESSEDILQFRLSQQPPVGQDLNSNKMQSPSNGFPRNSDTEFVQNSEKSKMPALNYKSRMNVPVSYQTKPDSKNSPTDSENSSMTETSEKQGEMANGNLQDFTASCRDVPHSPESPKRKCWETAGFSGKPCTTVSDSNNQSAGQSDASDVITCQKQTENGNKFNRVDSEMHRMLESTSSNDTSQQPEVNLQTREGDDTPKKGLALFIGEENTPNYDGLTPEQVRKREKFLRHRQQKIEDDKAKKEALLEKRRRKDEKLKELGQLREIEEESRQTRLQEKREQVEMVKQEREKYEMQRRENLARTNFVDGTLGNHAGYTKAGGKTRGIPGGSSGHTKAVKTPTTGSGAFEAQESVQANTPSAFSGFSGVQSYVRPSGKTNRKLIINAISHVCLPGAVNRETKEKCLQAMTESSAQHFIILFKEGLKFRGLYSLDLESNQVLKVHGIGPRAVTEKMIEQLYKYNSGGKEFLQIPAKGFSLSVDGFTLQKIYWQSNKPSVASKTSSNYKQTASKTWR